MSLTDRIATLKTGIYGLRKTTWAGSKTKRATQAMDTLQNAMHRELQELARQVLSDLIDEKLRAQNIKGNAETLTKMMMRPITTSKGFARINPPPV
jgi:hypothetical protein